MSQFYFLALCLTLLTGSASADAPRSSLAPITRDAPFTFAVFGDSRGGDDGQQPAAFLQILRAVNEASPHLSLHTGDMIYGHAKERSVVREQWRLYREAVATLTAPIFHAPGNHDIWDEPSARLYRELWSATYYAFDYGYARFIALDTETESSRLGAKQFNWLKRQLEEADQRIVFVFLHRPLFPIDGAIGSSLDRYPVERDKLHQLFVHHREKIKGIFLGHEHLYHFEERDGVPYHITGGGGAPLYMPPELGGFHHFLIVRVQKDRVAVELNKVGAPMAPSRVPARVAEGTLLESWDQGMFWYAWNNTVSTEVTPDRASEGRRGLRLNFDLAQNPWPVLVLPLASPWDLRTVDALVLDVYVAAELSDVLTLTAGVESKEKHEAPPLALKCGWNTVRMNLNGPWLPENERGAVKVLQWGLTAATNKNLRGSVVFDNFRSESRSASPEPVPQLLDGWERPLLWRVADESVTAETTSQWRTQGTRGTKINFDFAKCERATLFARLNPAWDLSKVSALTADVYAPDDLPPGLAISLALRSNEIEHCAKPLPLHAGWNRVKVNLNSRWLPDGVRSSAEQVEWNISSTNAALRGWIVFDNLRADGP